MLSQIKLAEKENISSLIDLLNAVTLSLHEKNINQWTYPWHAEELEKDISNKETYILTIDNKMAGTFSIKELLINPWLSDNKTSYLYLYRIAILPEYQGKNNGIEIVNYACKFAQACEKTLYLDCWAGNEKLNEFYSNSGFKFFGYFPEEDYMISVFKSE